MLIKQTGLISFEIFRTFGGPPRLIEYELIENLDRYVYLIPLQCLYFTYLFES